MKVVILGGGTAGWMSAAALVKALRPEFCQVRLIESDEIGTVGVGEATLPHIKDYNDFLGVDEAAFMRATNASFKLGIEFRNWAAVGDRYFHPFGVHGQAINGIPFYNYWLRARKNGLDPNIDDYSYPIVACRNLKFDFPSDDPKSIRSTFAYAYHFDAGLYARFLRDWAEAHGLRRTEGKIIDVALRSQDGHIASLTLASGEVVEGDLFIDCSGFRGLLINQELKVGWEDWSKWLPCDGALAVPCERAGDFTPYTRVTAQAGGWIWRIPLQHRTGNGYVFSSRFIDTDTVSRTLLDGLDGAAQADPRLIRFSAGRRTHSWTKNCIAVGLASGFLEPLESTSIYLVQMAVNFLIRLFPGRQVDPRLATEFNRLVDIEYERIRDFLILHYHATQRDDSELWRYVRHMEIPESLAEKMAQFRHRGHIHRYRDGLFSPASWIAVYPGQRVVASHYDRQLDAMPLDVMVERMRELRERVSLGVADMPSHADFLRDYCFVPGEARA